jgi:hypothetical protein
VTAGLDVTVEWNTANVAFAQASGVPVRIGVRNFARLPEMSPESSPAVTANPTVVSGTNHP